MAEHNKECLTLPPVIPKDYTTKGSNSKLGDLDVYITGSPTATKGIIAIYDIFGITSQTLQGADIISATLDAIVVLPDFFKGEAMKPDWQAADTEEKKQAIAKFRARAEFPGNIAALLKTTVEAKEKYPSVTAWGTYGLCWGGKVVALASGEGTPLKATGQTHPGRLAKEDALKITVPHIVLASKGEPTDIVAAYKEIIESNGIGGVVETYSTMHHGWMGAKANLEDAENRKEYERAYLQLAEFFKEHL